MLKLGVNIDHVATLRQARGGKDPDPTWAAQICEHAGAHSIVMHLREDRRHIQDHDLFRVKDAIGIKLNLEMSIAPGIVEIAKKLRPEQATLVPEKRRERTTEGGLDLFKKKASLRKVVESLRKRKIAVSLFIDPEIRQIEEAKKLGADSVEFHTGDYANQIHSRGVHKEFNRLKLAVQTACSIGIRAHAGHGLDYTNVVRLRSIRGLEELNIGYSIITRALYVGLPVAVKQMLELIK